MYALSIPSRMPRSVLYFTLLMAFGVIYGCWCDPRTSAMAMGPAPTFEELSQAVPQTAPSGGLEVGPEVSVLSADGSSEVGLGVRCNCETNRPNLGVTFGASTYFPESGSSYGAHVAAKLSRPTDGPANLFATAGPVFSRFSYSTEEYQIPGGDFGEFGGGAFQQGGGDAQNALGVRLGVGAEYDRAGSAWKPYGEVGYDIFVAGADFANQFRFAAGLTYALGAGQ